MYDSLSGRFCSRDPIGFEGSKWNVFEYVGSTPCVGVDPTGLANTRIRRGKCCNRSNTREWALVADSVTSDGSEWTRRVALDPGECVGSFFKEEDCEGMTCGGGFYAVSGPFASGSCTKNGCKGYKRWTPKAADPGAESPRQRGGSDNTPPAYPYGPKVLPKRVKPRVVPIGPKI